VPRFAACRFKSWKTGSGMIKVVFIAKNHLSFFFPYSRPSRSASNTPCNASRSATSTKRCPALKLGSGGGGGGLGRSPSPLRGSSLASSDMVVLCFAACRFKLRSTGPGMVRIPLIRKTIHGAWEDVNPFKSRNREIENSKIGASRLSIFEFPVSIFQFPIATSHLN
jgi:hypothetical protein